MLLLIFTPIVCSFAFTFGRSYMHACRLNRTIMEHAEPSDPAQTLVVFDLHGVLFNHEYGNMIKTFWSSPLKWRLLRGLLNPRLMWDTFKLLYRRPVPESFFMYLANNYKEVHDVLPLLISIANCQRTKDDTIKLVYALKNQGYRLAVLSNIGEYIFQDLEPHHHELFHLFDHIVVSTPETHYVSKPNPKMYQRLIDEADAPKQVILIDDKEKNICGGLKFGIVGILFKNAQQLQQRFKKLGIHI